MSKDSELEITPIDMVSDAKELENAIKKWTIK